MLPRNLSFVRLACALAALLAASACTTGTKETGTLTEPQVAALLQKWDDAQMSRDLEGITACLSARLQYKKTYQGLGPTETDAGDYGKYLAATKRGLGTDGQNLNTSRKIEAIGVNPDGQTAAVVAEVRDVFTLEGKLFRTVSSGTMTIGLEDGRAVITGIDEVVTIKAEGRQPSVSARD
jgi:hypothetical protein